MTFIASVVAKNGVALIADSLVTMSRRVLELEQYFAFLKEKFPDGPDGPDVHFDPKELFGSFRMKPAHTKDFEEKLFKFDHWTGITTAGNAEINQKRIGALMKELLPKIPGRQMGKIQRKGVTSRSIDEMIQDFRRLLDLEIRESVSNHGDLSSTTFIVSNFSPVTSKTRIFTVTVPACTKDDVAEPDRELTTIFENPPVIRVVCDGQTRLTQKLLFGVYPTLIEASERIINRVIQDFKIDPAQVPSDYQKNLVGDDSVVPSSIFDDLKIFKLADLSLQQAFDLARLLMRIEIDFQKYTENIPTVGGVIKIAIIDEGGFRWMAGHNVELGHHL